VHHVSRGGRKGLAAVVPDKLTFMEGKCNLQTMLAEATLDLWKELVTVSEGTPNPSETPEDPNPRGRIVNRTRNMWPFWQSAMLKAASFDI